jgi:hypothetical protein
MVAFTRIRAEGLTTPGGKPRCDVCRRAVFENQLIEYVNGRHRHRQCWPAHEATLRKFLRINRGINRANERKAECPWPALLRNINTLRTEHRQLEEREFLMNSAARCSREMHARLGTRSDETDAALALARAYRR